MGRRGIPFILSSPSGGGKSTLAARILDQVRGLSLCVSHTSRPPRPGERNGRDYHFVDREEFLRLRDAGGFVEWVRLHGNLYGTSRGELERLMSAGRDLLLDIDTRGARKVMELFPEARGIFILPPSLATLEKRLRKRGSESEEQMQSRLRVAAREIRAAVHYHYCVVNRTVARAAHQLEAVITAERLRLPLAERRDLVRRTLAAD